MTPRFASATDSARGRMRRAARRLSLLFAPILVACMSLSPGQQPWQPPVAPATARPLVPHGDCIDRSRDRNAYFGDLHVHTGFSMDARYSNLTATPDDAYRFARGQAILLPPLDANGNATRSVQIERPLDFTAVTDHAEWLAETSLCTRPDSPSYESTGCRIFRGEESGWIPGMDGLGARMSGVVGIGSRPRGVCGDDATLCRAELASVWQTTRDAAERWYDRSPACQFTTFQAWEYSASPGRSKVHRNVILRNEIAPELPISWLDEPDVRGLWRRLKELCIDTGSGCDALAIPHNPNLSNGRMFTPTYRKLPIAQQRAEASLRAELEPLVEMMQIKGESECRNGMAGVIGEVDELCDFEKLRGLSPGPEDCGDTFGSGATEGKGCVSRLDYARYVVTEGLREESRLGVNPYRLGFIGSTDTHNATPGKVEEYSYGGSDGTEDAEAVSRLSSTPGFAGASSVQQNPGGLMGAWAEENSREALFDAMQRRETFATSGTRITPRFFAGWEYPDDLCQSGDLVAQGYAGGVAMGGELSASAGHSRGPAFVVSALRDAGTESVPGTPLQRIQIVKGWVGADGLTHQAVFDVAGDSANGAGVDPLTCTPRGPGADSLCAVWRDPGFEAERAAVYYARVVENPSCRWHTRQCLSIPEATRPAACDDPRVPLLIQERAWTSPIWYAPS